MIKLNRLIYTSIVFGLVCLGLESDCSGVKGPSIYDFPIPIDTTPRTIDYQEKKVYHTEGPVSASNLFDGARLNDFYQKNDSLLIAEITPENRPINQSAWFAFKLWSEEPEVKFLRLTYPGGKHRYYPKQSHNGKDWSLLDSVNLYYNEDSTELTLKLALDQDTLWIAAQEIYNHDMGQAWCHSKAGSPYVHYSAVGDTPLGREIPFFEISHGSTKGKKVLVIFSRQHPPEVTGYLAMQAFVEGILTTDYLDDFLSEYVVLVYPMINPDGVDLGHWRHNSNGVDLNRDWAYYRQTETRLVASHLVKTVEQYNARVILGLDFHSTFQDVYYTLEESDVSCSTIPWLRRRWFDALEKNIPGYTVNERSAGLGAPVTKSWFYTQFGAEGITFEIGDNTPREAIQNIGSVSARELIQVLTQSNL